MTLSAPRAFIPPVVHFTDITGLVEIFSAPCDTTPGVAVPSSIEWDDHDVVGVNQSPFTGQVQTYDWRAAWWEARVSFAPMSRYSADAWSAFLSELRGPLNAFLLGDPKARVPKGSAKGVPIVDGAGQSGYLLATRGWVANQPTLLLPGDLIQMPDYRVHKVCQACSSDVDGKCSIPIWPPLRQKYADATVIVTRNCKGRFKLKAASGNKRSTNVGLYGLSGFDVREDLPVASAAGIIGGSGEWDGGGSGGSGGGGSLLPATMVSSSSWWNESGTTLDTVMAQGLVGQASFNGGAPVTIPTFAYSNAYHATSAGTVYAFFCLAADGTWRSFWGGALPSGAVPNSILVAARRAAGDLIFVAQWIYAPVGPFSVLTYVGGGVGVFGA